MADSSNRPKAEHVRSNYRKHLFKKRELSKSADGEGLAFTAPTIVDKIAGDADGLMPIGKIGAPLNVEIPVWPDRPDPGLPFTNVLYLDWRPVTVPASEYQSFHNEEVPDSGTLPDDEFPLERTIPLSVFANFEGKFEFRYRVKNWNSPVETDSDPSPVTIDRTGPLRPDVPDSIIVEKPLITTAVLEADGGVKCEVPDFDEDKKEFVTIAVAWLDEPPTGELDPVELAFLGLLPADRKILVPKDLVYKLGSKFHYVVYFLFDKAGNRSDMPYPVRVQVALGDLPDGLQAPEVPLADDDLIDRADAASPTTVRIQEYDNWTSEDGILIKWGLNKIKRTPVGTHLPFPLDITVPWSHLKDEYDFVKGGVQLKDVDYEVLRGDYPTASPGKIEVKVDLAIPGPDNPDPEPVNPALGLVRFESFSDSATELTLADIGEPATGYVTLVKTLLDELLKDDILTLYWNGAPVTSTPYTVTGSETADQEIPMTIPWLDIEKFPVMDDLPMHYTLTRPGFNNPQESQRTFIKVEVEIVDLPEPEFPDKDDIYPINCEALIQEGTEWGIRVHIPLSTYLKEGTEVTAIWWTYGKDKLTELTVPFLVGREVTEAEERVGLDWFIPYDKYLKPTYDTGDQYGWGKVIYGINVRGEVVSSDLVEVMIAVFEDGGHCAIPRP